jgi:hypothetical protein
MNHRNNTTKKLMSNKKHTAVEWLIEQCPRIETIVADYIIEQSKEMEKQQMKDAALSNVTKNEGLRKIFETQFEQYYKETYGHKEI